MLGSLDVVPVVIGPTFSLKVDTEKPVDSPLVTYLGCCKLSLSFFLNKSSAPHTPPPPGHFSLCFTTKLLLRAVCSPSLSPSIPHCHHQLLGFKHCVQFAGVFLAEPWPLSHLSFISLCHPHLSLQCFSGPRAAELLASTLGSWYPPNPRPLCWADAPPIHQPPPDAPPHLLEFARPPPPHAPHARLPADPGGSRWAPLLPASLKQKSVSVHLWHSKPAACPLSSGTPRLPCPVSLHPPGSLHMGPWLPPASEPLHMLSHLQGAPVPRPTLPLSLLNILSTVLSAPDPRGMAPPCPALLSGAREGEWGPMVCPVRRAAWHRNEQNLLSRGQRVDCSPQIRPLSWPHGQRCGCVRWAIRSPAWHTALGTSREERECPRAPPRPKFWFLRAGQGGTEEEGSVSSVLDAHFPLWAGFHWAPFPAHAPCKAPLTQQPKGLQKCPGQGSSGSNQSHSNDHARSLTCGATRELPQIPC